MKPFFFILGWVLLGLIIVVAWDARERARLHLIFDRLARDLGLTWNDGRLEGSIEGAAVTIERIAGWHRAPWLRVRASSREWTGPAEEAASAVRSLTEKPNS